MTNNEFLKKIVLQYKDTLVPLAKKWGLGVGHYGLAEALSTQALQAVLYKIIEQDNSWDYVSIKRKKLLSDYDVFLISGDTKVCVETKLRDKYYRVPKVSVNKIEKMLSLGGWVVNVFWDSNRYCVWDLSAYTPKISKKPWEKFHNTIDPYGKKETEYPYEFDTSKAIYSGTLNDNWLYETYFE